MRRSRVLGWDRNPLRRRIDRVEAAMVAGLIAVFLISAPGLASLAGHWIGSAGMRDQRAEVAWRLVPATVQGSAQGQIPSAPADQFWMPARWTAPDGQERRGWIPVSLGDAASGSTRVWVTPSGSLTGPPLRHAQLQAHIAIAEWLTALGLGFLLCLAGAAGRVLLARRRLADWNRAWREVEPRWTRQTLMQFGLIEASGSSPPRTPHVVSSPGPSAGDQLREVARVHAGGRSVAGHYRGGRLRRPMGSTLAARFISGLARPRVVWLACESHEHRPAEMGSCPAGTCARETRRRHSDGTDSGSPLKE